MPTEPVKMFSTMARSLVLVVLVAYFQSSVGDCPDDAKIGELQGDEMTEMLEEHNKVRSALSARDIKCQINQPRAQTLPPLVWDNDLATKACEVSRTCQRVHIPVTGPLEDKYGCVGQNLNVNYNSDDESLDSAKAVGAWREQCHKYNIRDLSKSNIFTTGEWTQLVWNTTTAVGCCKSTWPTDSDATSFNQLVVCNYGRCGNVNGVPPYTPFKK